MGYLTINQADLNIKIAKNIQSRENELASYAFETAHYQAAIAQLGAIAWTAETLAYKGLSRDVMIARAQQAGLTPDEVTQLANLQALDSYSLNLQAVAIETAKSQQAYQSLLTALPAGPDRDIAFAAITPSPTDTSTITSTGTASGSASS